MKRFKEPLFEDLFLPLIELNHFFFYDGYVNHCLFVFNHIGSTGTLLIFRYMAKSMLSLSTFDFENAFMFIIKNSKQNMPKCCSVKPCLLSFSKI